LDLPMMMETNLDFHLEILTVILKNLVITKGTRLGFRLVIDLVTHLEILRVIRRVTHLEI